MYPNTKTRKVTVADIVRLLEKIAPSYLAEDWDNCGLQVGALQWEVKNIWVALDPLLAVVEDAGRRKIDMVITHHPLIFRSLKCVDLATAEGKVIAAGINNRTAIYAAHSNLDSAAGGINDILARKIGLNNIKPLISTNSDIQLHRRTDDAVPSGLGRVGDLRAPVTVSQWVPAIKKCLGLTHVKVAGDVEMRVHRASVCSGSGGGLMEAFLKSNTDVFVSGDLRYHDARAVEDAGRAFIDIGHFQSEHIIVDALVKKLTSAVQDVGWDVLIEPCTIEKDPFKIL